MSDGLGTFNPRPEEEEVAFKDAEDEGIRHHVQLRLFEDALGTGAVKGGPSTKSRRGIHIQH